MTTNDLPATAIDALLWEHAHAITGDPEEAEAETQFHSLQRKLDALEPQLIVLTEAKKATLKGNFDSRARTFDLLDWDQGLTGSIGSLYGNTTGARHPIPSLFDYNLSQSGLGSTDSAYELDFAAAPHAPDRLDWRRNRVGRIAVAGDSTSVVPWPQALNILDWCQETIERIARSLTPNQIDQLSKPGDRDFATPWSPSTMGRIILKDRLQRRILSLEKQVVALRQQRNAQLPIARLPLEILIQVFCSVMSTEPPERRDETFILCRVLMRICHNWAGIIQNTPGLWNRISPYSSSSREVMGALNRSRPYPLSVWFHSTQMSHILPGHFLDLITEHVDRWKVLELHLTGMDPRGILNGRLAEVFPPRIRRLRVSLEPYGFLSSYDSRIRLFGGRWPISLKHFGLVGWGMDSSRYAELEGLATLEISQLPSRQEVRMVEILYILSNCPGLERLTLSGRIVLDEQSSSGTVLLKQGLPVELDHLREISLSLEPAPMNVLLRSMKIDNCTKFCIGARQPPDSGSTWTESLLTDGIRCVLDSVLSSTSAISIEVYNDFIELLIDPPESDFMVRLTFRGTELAEVGRWMVDCLTLGPAPVTLYFAVNGSAWMETLPLILSNFNHIVQLTFVGLDTTYRQAIDFLGTPIQTEATGHQHFPAPNLACMDVMAEYIPHIIHMVERRQSAEVGGVESPVKLSRVILRRNPHGQSPENETIGRLLSALAGGQVEVSIF